MDRTDIHNQSKFPLQQESCSTSNEYISDKDHTKYQVDDTSNFTRAQKYDVDKESEHIPITDSVNIHEK